MIGVIGQYFSGFTWISPGNLLSLTYTNKHSNYLRLNWYSLSTTLLFYRHSCPTTMADLTALDAVYAKWEKQASSGPFTKRHQAADQAVEHGRKAWRSKFQEVSAPPQRRRTTRGKKHSSSFDTPVHIITSNLMNLMHAVFRSWSSALWLQSITTLLGDFKKNPSIKPLNNLYKRPVTTRCCTCMPISRVRCSYILIVIIAVLSVIACTMFKVFGFDLCLI